MPHVCARHVYQRTLVTSPTEFELHIIVENVGLWAIHLIHYSNEAQLLGQAKAGGVLTRLECSGLHHAWLYHTTSLPNGLFVA